LRKDKLFKLIEEYAKRCGFDEEEAKKDARILVLASEIINKFAHKHSREDLVMACICVVMLLTSQEELLAITEGLVDSLLVTSKSMLNALEDALGNINTKVNN